MRVVLPLPHVSDALNVPLHDPLTSTDGGSCLVSVPVDDWPGPVTTENAIVLPLTVADPNVDCVPLGVCIVIVTESIDPEIEPEIAVIVSVSGGDPATHGSWCANATIPVPVTLEPDCCRRSVTSAVSVTLLPLGHDAFFETVPLHVPVTSIVCA